MKLLYVEQVYVTCRANIIQPLPYQYYTLAVPWDDFKKINNGILFTLKYYKLTALTIISRSWSIKSTSLEDISGRIR